jgi:HAD superfamily hydrolase (TIGR01490 family)
VRGAAFFDLDHTLLIGTSGERLFLRALRRHGQLKAADALRWLVQLAREPRLTGGFFRRNKRYLAGKPLIRIREVALEAAREAEARISPRGRERLAEHRRAGRLVVVVSGTLDVVMEPLARALGVDVAIASCLASEGGRLTGELTDLYPRGENKRLLIERLAAERGLDLGRSWAYGDDWHDLPMLEAVGHPVAVNPRARLKRVAVERGWPIESF